MGSSSENRAHILPLTFASIYGAHSILSRVKVNPEKNSLLRSLSTAIRLPGEGLEDRVGGSA